MKVIDECVGGEGRGRKNGIYRNLLESINDTLPRVPLVTVMPRVCRDSRHVRLRKWNEMWGDIKCTVLNFFSHADNRHTVSQRPTHGKTLTGQFHWTKMDLIQIFPTNHFRLFEALRIYFCYFSLLQTLLFNRLTLAKTRTKASQPSAVDEFFRVRDGSGGWEGSILDLKCDFLHYWHI